MRNAAAHHVDLLGSQRRGPLRFHERVARRHQQGFRVRPVQQLCPGKQACGDVDVRLQQTDTLAIVRQLPLGRSQFRFQSMDDALSCLASHDGRPWHAGQPNAFGLRYAESISQSIAIGELAWSQFRPLTIDEPHRVGPGINVS